MIQRFCDLNKSILAIKKLTSKIQFSNSIDIREDKNKRSLKRRD